MSAVLPAARPVVKVLIVDLENTDIPLYGAHCQVPGCGWKAHRNRVKVAVSDEARWHREAHRRAAAQGGAS